MRLSCVFLAGFYFCHTTDENWHRLLGLMCLNIFTFSFYNICSDETSGALKGPFRLHLLECKIIFFIKGILKKLLIFGSFCVLTSLKAERVPQPALTAALYLYPCVCVSSHTVCVVSKSGPPCHRNVKITR